MNGTEFFTCTLGIRTHAAFSDNDTYAGQFCKFILEFLHTHGSSRSDRNHLVIIFCSLNFPYDRAGMENCLVFDIIWKLSSVLNESAVCNVTAGHEIAVQPNNISDVDIFQVFCAYRCNQNFFISSNFDHNYIHSFRFAQAQNVMKMFP